MHVLCTALYMYCILYMCTVLQLVYSIIIIVQYMLCLHNYHYVIFKSGYSGYRLDNRPKIIIFLWPDKSLTMQMVLCNMYRVPRTGG